MSEKDTVSIVLKTKVTALQEKIGYFFKKVELLEAALTHPSMNSAYNNQRLEFLGDRVLGLIICDYLYNNYFEEEGKLAKRLNVWVCKQTCAEIAEKINLGYYLYLASSESESGGRKKVAILGDAIEALIAAIYLDGGLEQAKKFIMSLWKETLENITPMIDAKSELQEWSQSLRLGLPEYTVVNRSGPDHQPVFIVEVYVAGYEKAKGQGNSKRNAEHVAAQNFLTLLAKAEENNF